MSVLAFWKKRRREDIDSVPEQVPPEVPGDLSVYGDVDSFASFDRDLYEEELGYVSGSERWHGLRLSFITGVVSFAVLTVFAGYMIGVVQYSFHFCPRSYLNDEEVSGKSSAMISSDLRKQADAYQLTVHLREGDFVLGGAEVGLDLEYEPSISSLLAEQNTFLWPFSFLKRSDYTAELVGVYDDMDAKLAIGNRFTHFPENHESTSAFLKLEEDGSLTYRAGVASSIREESVGRELILEALSRMDTELDLRESDMYLEPYDVNHDPALQQMTVAWNERLSQPFGYDLGEQSALFMVNQVLPSLSYEQGVVSVSRGALLDLVSGWYSVNVEDLSTEEKLAFESTVYRMTNRLAMDVRAGHTEGMGQPFDPNLDSVVRVDLSAHTVSVVHDGAVQAVFSAGLKGLSSWDALEPSAASLLVCGTDTLRLSNGLEIGSEAVTGGLVVKGFDHLLSLVSSDPPAYLLFTRGDDAAALQHPVFLADVGADDEPVTLLSLSDL